MTAALPRYLVDMVRRRVPVPEVVAGSTPVVAFGDPTRATVATLGINPSAREFVENGFLLDGQRRRLATLTSLGATSTNLLSDEQILAVLRDCSAYFQPDKNPYRRWFDPLDRLLQAGLGVSYYAGTACHLDLVQWATDPVWGKLADPVTRAVLLADGVPHLRDQLRYAGIRTIVLNGKQVLDQVQAVELARLHDAGRLKVGRVTCGLYEGELNGVRCVGWSTNLQSSFGVSREFVQALAVWLRSLYLANGECSVVDTYEGVLDKDGYINDTTVDSKRAFTDLLQHWLHSSMTPTIGNPGTYGRRPCIKLDLNNDVVVVLNADTSRIAVEEFVAMSIAHGVTPEWTVAASRGGMFNKVNFRTDGADTPGWYCYLRKPFTARGSL